MNARARETEREGERERGGRQRPSLTLALKSNACIGFYEKKGTHIGTKKGNTGKRTKHTKTKREYIASLLI